MKTEEDLASAVVAEVENVQDNWPTEVVAGTADQYSSAGGSEELNLAVAVAGVHEDPIEAVAENFAAIIVKLVWQQQAQVVTVLLLDWVESELGCPTAGVSGDVGELIVD